MIAKVYGNVLRVLGGKTGAGIIGLAYLALVTRTLGPQGFGVLVSLHAFEVTVALIVAFPAWQAVVRFGSEALAANDLDRMFNLLRSMALFELTIGALAVAIAAILAPYLAQTLGWPESIGWLLVPYSLAVLGSVRSVPLGVLQLYGRFDLIGWHNLVMPIVRLTGAVLAWALGAGLEGFIIAWLAGALAEWAAMWALGLWIARSRLGDDLFRKPSRVNLLREAGVWRFLLASNIDVTLSEFSGKVSPLVISWILGPAATGIYSVAQRAMVIIAQPAQILGQTAYADLARLAAAQTPVRRFRRAFASIIGIAVVAAILVVTIVSLFSRQVVELVAGDAYLAAAPLMIWLVVGRAIAVVAPPASSALSALGRPAVSMTINIVTTLCLLPLLIVVLRQAGLIGSGYFAVVQAIASSTLLSAALWRYSRLMLPA